MTRLHHSDIRILVEAIFIASPKCKTTHEAVHLTEKLLQRTAPQEPSGNSGQLPTVAEPEVCRWEVDACGNSRIGCIGGAMLPGHPHYRFCPYCGKRIATEDRQ